MRFLSCVVLALSLGVVAAGAKPPLRSVAEIDDGLMAVAIADRIRKSCDAIDARMIRAAMTLYDLKSLARAKGYSDKEIELYVTSSEEKERMRAKAVAWLAARGVDASDVPALCAFGKLEIDRGSAIGRLLK